MRSPEEEAEDLRFRLNLYRAMKEGAWFLRERLKEQDETWWSFEGYEAKKDDSPQQRLL